ncbi:MAG: MFS transporter [Anaerolineae bacterium]|nr:MFS transporter [Anaerolineae bacterium]
MDEKTRGRTLLAIAFMAFLAIGLPNGALNVAWIHMQQSFGVSLESLGVLLGATTVGRLVMSFYSGRIIAWMTIGRFLLAGSAVMLAGLLGMTTASSWLVLVVAAVVFGTGGGALNAGVNTFAAARFNSSRMNWLHAWYGVGSALGPLLVTVVVIDLGQDWRWAYAVLVALQILLTLAFLTTLNAWQLENRTEQPTTAAPRVRARDTLRLGMVWFGITLFFLHGGIQVGTGQLSNSLFVEGRGIDARVVATWISVYWACLTAGRIFTGLFVERVGNALFLRISMFVTVIGAALVWCGMVRKH